MDDLERLMTDLPHLHRIQVQVVGRYSGKRRKYEISYYDSQHSNTAVHRFTADTVGEAFAKLRRKLANPDYRVGCHCGCCH